jgi:hypothetical protein
VVAAAVPPDLSERLERPANGYELVGERREGALEMAKVLVVLYVVIGVIVAAANDYFDRLNRLRPILSALLAVLLWPLVLFGVDIRIGDIENNGRAILGLFR